MFARGARAAQRALTATSRTLTAASPLSSPTATANVASLNQPVSVVKASRTFAATMATVPVTMEVGSQASCYVGGLLNPADLTRISNDLSTMKRRRIEGPHVPRAKAVLVPLCHDLDGVPHALFTVRPCDFDAPHADFPGGARATDDSTAIAAAIREACAELRLDDHAKLRILGLTSDCPDMASQTAVTPIVGYLGAVDIAAMKLRVDGARCALEGTSPTLMALSLDHLLSEDAVEARMVPGVGPMPVFNASCVLGGPPTQIWGLTAQILHGVMRVVVGARAEYKDVLYGRFMRKTAGA